MSGTFTLVLEKFSEKVSGQASDLVGLVVLKIAARLDFRSPVGDATYWKNPPPKGYIGGHFRANWQLGVDIRPSGEVNSTDRSAKNFDMGGATTGRILASLPGDGLNAGHVYWIANNAPYAMRLEEGHSRQAPVGLVGLTAVEFSQIVRQSAEALP